MSCSMIAAEMPLDRTTDVTVSMIGVFSRVLAARRLVEEQELRPERVRDGDVEELALALRDAAREHLGLPLEAEEPEDLERLVPHGVVGARERGELPGLALAREDRQRDVVERAQLVEQVHELKAP